MSTKSTLFGLLGLIAFLQSSCNKNEMDFNKFKGYKPSPEIITPLAQVYLKASDLLKQDSIIQYDPDGLIRFVYRDDSVYYMGADSVLDNINFSNAAVDYTLGNVTLPSILSTKSITLNEMLVDLDPTTSQFFTDNDGKDTLFPAVEDASNTSYDANKATNYEYLNISQGHMVIAIENTFPVEITEFKFQLVDKTYNRTAGVFTYSNIAPGATSKDSVNLAWQTLSNNLGIVLTSLKMAGSTGNVRIDLTDAINIRLSGQNWVANGGKAIISNQSIPSQVLSFDMSDPNSDFRLKNVRFGSAKMSYQATSDFAEILNLTVGFPDATVSGSPLAATTLSLPKGSKSGTFDFSNANLHLGSVPTQAYNMLRASISGSIQSSGQLVVFDSADQVSIDIDPGMAVVDYVDGYLGSKTWQVDISGMDFSALNSLGNGIRLTNPEMILRVDNGFGMPIKTKLNMIARDDMGTEVNIAPPTFNFAYPSIAQAGNIASSAYSINKNNSKLVDALALPPSTMDINGTAVLNADGFVGYRDHAGRYSKLKIGYEANLPMSLIAKNFSISDTADIGTALSGTEKFDFLELTVKTINGFPFEGTIDLYFCNDQYQVLGTMKDITVVTSAIPDANGKPGKAGENTTVIRLDNALLKQIGLENASASQIIFSTLFNTYDQGNQSVSIYTDCDLSIALGFRGKYNGQ
jgi:hypothetical protein